MRWRLGERFKQLTEKVRAFFGKLSKRAKVAIAAILAIALIAVAALAVYRMSRPYAVLFTGLSDEDMTAVVTYLNENSTTDFRIRSDGTIEVPASQENALRAQVVQQGYPTSGFAYKRYSENVGTLSSAEDRQRAYQFDLQDRLGATIRCFKGVKDANVTIAMGEDHRYILSDEEIEATAEVTVTMENGQTLTDQQANSIRNLVSHATQGLQVDNVFITDDAGNSYSGGAGGSLSDSANLKLSLESQVNNLIRGEVMQVLIPLFGSENVRVSVNSSVDISHTYREDLEYEEPSWAKNGETMGQGIIGRRVWDNSLIRGNGNNAGGVVGTSTNADLNEYVVRQGDLNGSEREIYTSGETVYDVTTHNTQKDIPGGTVTDVMVAITINSSEVNVPNTANLVDLVARAAGINAEVQGDKISILAYPFHNAASPSPLPNGGGFLANFPTWAIYALIAGVALFLALLLVIVLLGSKKRKRVREEEQAAIEAANAANLAAALEAATGTGIDGSNGLTEGANIMNIANDKSQILRQDIRKFVEENPSIAAQMVKNWLRGGEENG